MPETMRAATMPDAGSGRMAIETVPVPTPRKGEVLVQVHSAGVNEMDTQTRQGGWAREVKNFRKLGPVVTGFEFAGVTITDGARLPRGTRVVGYSPVLKGPRAHAEFAAVPESALGAIPESITFEEATALCVMGLTAIDILERIRPVSPGDHVAVIGAAGGVGAYATQLATAKGAQVTGIARASAETFVRDQGATAFRAYDEGASFENGDRFGLIIDTPPVSRFAATKRYLAPGGMYVSTNPFADLAGFPRSMLSRRKAGWLLMLTTDPSRIARLIERAGEGALRPVIDSRFPMSEVNAAFDRYETRGKQGRVILDMTT